LRRTLALLFALLVSLPLVSLRAEAQGFPNRAIKLVVPYAAGGLPDTMMRIVQLHAAEFLGQQTIVENRGGAGGIAGTEAVAKSPPDGYTLLVADVGQVAINPHIFSKLPYDAQKDFTPVTLIGTSRLFLCLHPSVPANTFEEFVAYVKSHPGKVNYGSSGVGSIHHLATEALNTALGLNMTHVPYKGMGQAVPALISGEVQVLYSALPAIESYIRGGKLKMVAVSTLRRSAEAPEIPTVAELGVPGYHFAPEIGILAPAGTPAPIVQKLAAELGRAARHPDTVARFKQLGIDAVGSSSQEYATAIQSSYQRYGEVAKAAGVKAD
jgi:tripartite-type tricarboxylate transporter receptor subunit TctC